MRIYQAHHFKGIKHLDGKLNKAPWTECAWSDDFVDIEGDIRAKPRFRTRMKMFWAEDGLYIAAEMEEPEIWATLTERDSVIFHDNDFEVFLDPDNDALAYAELEINAFNTVWDLLLVRPYRDGGRGVDGWDIKGLRTAVHIDGHLNNPKKQSKGWSVEIHIPWHPIEEISRKDVPPKPGDQWKINFSRVEWHVDVLDGKFVKRPGFKEDNWVWSPQGVVDMHQPEQWGIVEFVKG